MKQHRWVGSTIVDVATCTPLEFKLLDGICDGCGEVVTKIQLVDAFGIELVEGIGREPVTRAFMLDFLACSEEERAQAIQSLRAAVSPKGD